MPAQIARNIILVGLMGTGKSSLARILSRRTGALLIDTDVEIEKRESRKIAAIFAESGEAYFRTLETELLREYQEKNGCIISTGGGIVITEENRRLLPDLGLVVWLHASLDVIFGRVSKNNHRPLLRTADPKSTLQELFELREPWYREVAHLQVDTGENNRTEAVRLVLEAAGWQCKTA
ncbi:MAG TPA: shikimate kinase [Chthoniobacterales bacterium]|jgi:shikimate kinase